MADEEPHKCCEHAREWFVDCERAWGIIKELTRRHYITQSAVRGNDRFINKTSHHGMGINTPPAT